MHAKSSATSELRFSSCAWVQRFVRVLIRDTARSEMKWRANRRHTRYTSIVVRGGHRLSVAVTYKASRGPMFRVACITHRGSPCTDGVGFFMADGRRDHSPLEKFWREIRNSCCRDRKRVGDDAQ